jgi:hypothetical protein
MGPIFGLQGASWQPRVCRHNTETGSTGNHTGIIARELYGLISAEVVIQMSGNYRTLRLEVTRNIML